jgi:adhesin/invasin
VVDVKRVSFLLVVFLLSLLVVPFVFSGVAVCFGAGASSQLKIYAGPVSVLADNRGYEVLVVQLQDGRGVPLRAPGDVEVRLSSSLTSVGNVDSAVTIPKGETCVSANFYATYTPGATVITAAASGYTAVQTTVNTVGPIPSALAVYVYPPVLPADGNSYGAVVVQLQDSSGSPAKAPTEGVTVTLSSSNSTVTAVDSVLRIEAGDTYSVANVKPNNAGSAVITATASGYASGQATLKAQVVEGVAVKLQVCLAPPKVPADGNTYQQVAVQLQDAKGKLATFPTNTIVTLSSSNTAVGTVKETLTIPAGKTYALASFTTTYQSGSTSITAAATNCTTHQATISTVGPVPSKLAVYVLPSVLPADGETRNAIQVQLQDSKGKPAKDPVGDILVYLSSSAPEVGSVNATLTIPFGETQAAGAFTSTNAASSTSITAQTSGYTSGQAKITTNLIDPVFLGISVTAESSVVDSANKTTLRAYVTYNGTDPASKATVTFTSPTKGSSFSKTVEEGNGYYTAVFTAPKVTRQTTCNVTVNATKTGYQSAASSIKLTVELNSSAVKGTLQLLVAEENGDPVTDASITVQSSAGSQMLTGFTNSTGFVTLVNLPEGAYTVQAAKSGYETQTATVQLSGKQTAYQTLNLSKADAGFFSLPVIIGIVAAVIVAVVAVVFIRRRRSEDEPQPVGFSTPKKGRKKQNSPSPYYNF